MATLIRRNAYATVPGFDQPDPISGYTTFTMPYAGVGGSNTNTVGLNPVYNNEAPSSFFVTNPTTNYSQFRQDYDADTGKFGILASFYGPNMRRAQATNLRDLYPNDGFQNFGYGGTNTGVSVAVDWDLANKQAQPGSVAWFRKVASDYTPTNQAVFESSMDFLASRNPGYAKVRTAEKNEARINEAVSRSDWNRASYSIEPQQLRPSEMRSAGGNIVSGNRYLSNDYRTATTLDTVRKARLNNATAVSNPVEGNRPNQNLFGGGFSPNVFRDDERLFNSGGWSSPRISISGPTRASLRNW